MPVVLIAFIVMISLAVWSPGARDQLASEEALDGAVTAGQLRTWHAAAVRSCYLNKVLVCTSNRGIVFTDVLSAMPPMVANANPYGNSAFRSYYENGRVISMYSPYYAGYGPNLQAEANSETLSALIASASPSTLTSIGYWNPQTGRFRSGSYTSIDGGTTTRQNPVEFATMANTYSAAPLSHGTPMMVSRLR